MSSTGKGGDIEFQLIIPFERPVMAFATARDTHGHLYIAALRRKTNDHLLISVVRLNANNVPDPDYGSNGFADISFVEYEGLAGGVYGLAMVLQDDGGLIVVGRGMGLITVAAFARLDSSGQLDQTFGDAGRAVHYFGRTSAQEQVSISSDQAHVDQDPNSWRSRGMSKVGARLVQSSERLLYFAHDAYDSDKGFVAQFKLNGRLDTEFGDEGITKLIPPGPAGSVILHGMAELADGKLAVYGHMRYAAPPYKGVVARLLSTGQPDETFGDRGYLLIDAPPEVSPESVLRLTFKDASEGSDASLVLSAELITQTPTGSLSYYGLVAYFDKLGTPVADFNSGKPVVFNLLGHGNGFWGITLQDGGKVVATGFSEVLGSTPMQVDYLVARFNADGTRDLTFGGQGFVSGALDPGINYVDLVQVDRGLITALVKYHDNPSNPLVDRLHFLGFKV